MNNFEINFDDGESMIVNGSCNLHPLSHFKLPAGTTAQRPTGVSVGTIRFNSDTDAAEIYKADDGTGSAGWAAISGGGPAVGTDSIIRTNAPTIVENITIGPTANGDAKYTNGMTAGPVSINNGFIKRTCHKLRL